jgi:hypothetical protein
MIKYKISQSKINDSLSKKLRRREMEKAFFLSSFFSIAGKWKHTLILKSEKNPSTLYI